MSNQTRLFVICPEHEALLVEALLEGAMGEIGYPVALFEIEPDSPEWAVSVYVDNENTDRVADEITGLLEGDGFAFKLERETLGNVNWVAQTLEALSPVQSGRFLVHGSHDRHIPRPFHHAVEIDAGLAFGTGHHGTTAGCLDMLGKCLKRTRYSNALDIGTGSGVLAIAAAKAGIQRVLATDIDPVATVTADFNVRHNGSAAQVTCVTATGFNHTEIKRRKPYDLIIANILARPLEKMAHEMAKHAAGNATIILSGLLPHQKARIVAAYRAQGFHLGQAHYRDGWLVLVMKKAGK